MHNIYHLKLRHIATQRIYVFCTDLRTNSDYFPTQKQPFCVCKELGSSLYVNIFFFGGGGYLD